MTATDNAVPALVSVPAKPVSDSATDMLRRAGQSLLQSKRLVQKHPVSALQLHDTAKVLDNILITPGHTVAILTDKTGQAAIAYANERPHWQVKGWLPDMRAWVDLQKTNPPQNLIFDKQPQNRPKNEELPQAILAISWAHKVFSDSQYNIGELVRAVKNLLDLLPDNGQLLIQDFALPEDHDRFVVIELDDDEAIQALQEFSETARPYAPKALRGFFIEPLSAERSGRQRFRLPLKWAVEFYHRWRLGIAVDAPYELTTLSLSQWVAVIEQCGARATYRAPYYPGRRVIEKTRQDLRFYDESNQLLSLPASSFTLLVEKVSATEPVHFYERRISGDKAQDITVSSLRNTKTNDQLDLVEVTRHEDDVLPWYRDDEGRLHVLICTNVARPIINSVPRGTANLDGRQWAGYLVEPVTIAHLPGDLSPGYVVEQAQQLLGLDADDFGEALESVAYYPAPEYLLQRVRGILLPLHLEDNSVPFPEMHTEQGRVIDVLAEDVLQAIAGGLIPDGKLEILIGKLMLDLGIDIPNATGEFNDIERDIKTKLTKDRREVVLPRTVQSGEHLMEYIADKPTENLRAVRSVFAEDQVTAFGRQVARYNEHDFIVSSKHSSNTAVIVPFTRDPSGQLMLSAEPRKLPIPKRFGNKNEVMHLPSFSLPENVRTIDQVRQFIAEQIKCSPNDLYELGPSFFVQPQVSFERVYPFILFTPATANTFMRWFKPRAKLANLLVSHLDKTTAVMEYKAVRALGPFYKGFGPDMEHALKKAPKPEPAPMLAGPARKTSHKLQVS